MDRGGPAVRAGAGMGLRSARGAVARWTSAGFTKPLRLVLESVFRPEREVEVRTAGTLVQEVRYRSEVPHLFDTLLYEPSQRVALRAARSARRLQSGSLRAYILYLLGLVLVLLAAVQLGVIA